MDPVADKLQTVHHTLQALGQRDPAFLGAYQQLMQVSKKSGALSQKMKELIGIAVSVKAQCDRCIVWHVKAALDAGATPEEIIEASEQAVLLGGGPALMYLGNVLDALQSFTPSSE